MDVDGILRCPRCLMEYDGVHCEHCRYLEDEATSSPGYLETDTILANRYLIGCALGVGGFGVTYSAWDMTLNQPVAVKEYFPSGVASRDISQSDDVTVPPDERNRRAFDTGRKRFIREARMLALLEECPDIVSVRDCFESNQTAYIVMEFVRGESLSALAKRSGGTIAPKRLLSLMRGPIEALGSVHQAGLLHRDISPSNLMLGTDGRVKLIDFGAAADLSEDGLARDATMILHRGFAAPEQYLAGGKLGTWTDVYGVCATLFTLLTGHRPNEAEDFHPGDLKRLLPPGAHLSSRQIRAIQRGLHPNWKDRTQSVPELLSGLYNVPLPEELQKRKRLIRLAVGSTCTTVCLVLLLLLNTFVGLPGGAGLVYRLSWGGFSLFRYIGNAETLEVPDRFCGLPVQQIEQGAFMNNADLQTLTIPEGILSVGGWAFYGCERLQEVYLDEGVERIGALAFGDCAQLKKVVVPQSVGSIDTTAFDMSGGQLVLYGTSGSQAEYFAREKDLAFADTSEFEYRVEDGCAVVTDYRGSATDLVVPQELDGYAVISIESAVGWPYKMSRVRLPESLTVIGDHVFEDCICLERIDLPGGLETIEDCAFLNCGELRVIELPAGVRRIGAYAFSVCRGLETAVLPDSLAVLDEGAFERCEKLTEIALPDMLAVIGDGAFSGCVSLAKVRMPKGLETVGQYAFYSCASLAEIVIPEGTLTIGEGAFMGCDSLAAALIPPSVQTIGECAFYSCSNNLVIFGEPGSAAEAYAKENSITFEDMGSWAPASDFEYSMIEDTVIIRAYHGSAADLVVPSYVEGIRVIALSENSLSNGAFQYNEELRSVTLPRYIAEIPNSCFDHCTSLESVVLPAGLRRIGTCAFNACAALVDITLPDSLTAIEWMAFDGCSALEELILPGNDLILSAEFLGDSQVKRLHIADGCVRIENWFDGCDALEVIYIPASVTFIEQDTFEDCKERLTIVGQPGSYAESYARTQGIAFQGA